MQILLGYRELAREPLHSSLQLLRHCWLYPLRLPQELAPFKDAKQGDAPDHDPFLA